MRKLVCACTFLAMTMTLSACGSDSYIDDYEPGWEVQEREETVYADEGEEYLGYDEDTGNADTNGAIPNTFSETNLVIGEIFTKDEILEYVNADSQHEVYAIKKNGDAFEILYAGYKSATGGDSNKAYDVVEFAHLHKLNKNWSGGDFAFTYSGPATLSLSSGEQLVAFGATNISGLTKIEEVRYCVPLLFEEDLDGNLRLNENLAVNQYFYPYASCGEETKEDALEVAAIETINGAEAWNSGYLEVFDPDSKLIKYFLVSDIYNEVVTTAGYAATQYLEYSYWCNAYLYTLGEVISFEPQRTEEGYSVVLEGAGCPDGISIGDIYSGGMFAIEIAE